MWFLDKLAQELMKAASSMYDASDNCKDVPLLGDRLSQPFLLMGQGLAAGAYAAWEVAELWDDMVHNTGQMYDDMRYIMAKLQEVIPWRDLRGTISREWNWLDDPVGKVKQPILDAVVSAHSELVDMGGWVRGQIKDYSESHYAILVDPWGVLADGMRERIEQWYPGITDLTGTSWEAIQGRLAEWFWGFAVDFAHHMTAYAGKILDKVWYEELPQV